MRELILKVQDDDYQLLEREGPTAPAAAMKLLSERLDAIRALHELRDGLGVAGGDGRYSDTVDEALYTSCEPNP